MNKTFLTDFSTASSLINGEIFTKPVNLQPGNYFGFELSYDRAPAVGGAGGSLYNGNISSMAWKSGHDGQIRQYGFTYDALSRLTGADFNQFTNSSFNKLLNIDFTVNNLTFDDNGNIKTMNQMGLTSPGVSGFIDQLTYTYQTGSNKLQAVTDAHNDNASTLGDFKYNAGTKTTTDYGYDNNGNMNSDANKNISGITYNYLNLP